MVAPVSCVDFDRLGFAIRTTTCPFHPLASLPWKEATFAVER